MIGLGCDRPCSTCFCTTAGCGPYHEEGLDVLLVDAGDHYLAKALTDKGTTFLEGRRLGKAAAIQGREQMAALRQELRAKHRLARADREPARPPATDDLYGADFWEEVSFACINCGTCTFSCPTCWCFDIQDEIRGSERRADRRSGTAACSRSSPCTAPATTPAAPSCTGCGSASCTSSSTSWTSTTAGSCVGCGRCVRLCPVNIDIRRVATMMNGFAASGEACAID